MLQALRCLIRGTYLPLLLRHRLQRVRPSLLPLFRQRLPQLALWRGVGPRCSVLSPIISSASQPTPSSHTSAAFAAAALASEASLAVVGPPSDLPGPELILEGIVARGGDCGGGSPRVRPGWPHGSSALDGLPKQFPIAGVLSFA